MLHCWHICSYFFLKHVHICPPSGHLPSRKSTEERGFERQGSSQSLLTRTSASMPRLFRGVRKRTRFLVSLLYFLVMVGIVLWSMANQHGYPKHAMDTRCYPCLCTNGQKPGTLRLQSCWLASTLRDLTKVGTVKVGFRS